MNKEERKERDGALTTMFLLAAIVLVIFYVTISKLISMF